MDRAHRPRGAAARRGRSGRLQPDPPADELLVLLRREADSGNRIQKFNSEGEYLGKFGTSGSGAGQFNTPFGIAVDPSDSLLIADSLNLRVQRWER